ncbi:MAG: gamma-glutamyltransferase [Candidatus Lambdaproteobacteria bacterium]|nr:gamma-glutamyltransferase [Candidatus Lambdaproteobacteria bacterium]
MRDFQAPGRSLALGTNGMVATSHPLATLAGLDVLRGGGNALDAAVSACATQCVVEPMSTGIGGDCFVLYHEAATGTLHGLNASGRAPTRATAEAIRARGHRSMPLYSILSVTVPGAVDGWAAALARFGRRSLGDALQPAIAYAEEGYPVTPVVASAWQRAEARLRENPAARKALLVGDKAPVMGSRHRQPDLARTLRTIAGQGRAGFYEGPVAQAIVRASDELDGLFTLEDFAAQHAEWVEPIETEYRGVRLREIPPNGQGITALMMLNILRHEDLGAKPRLGADHVHWLAEAYNLAVAERDRFVTDPRFHGPPVAALLSDDYAVRQHARVSPQRALPHPVPSGLPAHRDTVYVSVVDRDGNAASFINSLFHNFGSGLVAGETGVVLHNRGISFVLDEGHDRCIAPGKRPMHTIIPAMGYRGEQPWLCFGVMGAHYQPMGHAYVLSNVLDFGLDLQEAIDAPRFLPEAGKLVLERHMPAATREELQRRGHAVAEAPLPWGGGQAIMIDRDAGTLIGASDPRKDGCALGY